MSTVCTENKIEKIANKLLDLTFQTDNYIEVVDIAEKLGFTVYETNFDDSNISGFIEIDEDEPANNKICVNKEHCNERQRFTIAHEIGHYVLEHLASDCRKYRRVDFTNNDDSVEEKQANKFAANLLMPRKRIEDVWNKFKDIKIVAATFGVSEEVANYRIMNLKLG